MNMKWHDEIAKIWENIMSQSSELHEMPQKPTEMTSD